MTTILALKYVADIPGFHVTTKVWVLQDREQPWYVLTMESFTSSSNVMKVFITLIRKNSKGLVD